MRIELTRVGLLVYLANHYTTRGAHVQDVTQGQHLCSAGLNSLFAYSTYIDLLSPTKINLSYLSIAKKRWIHDFPKGLVRSET